MTFENCLLELFHVSAYLYVIVKKTPLPLTKTNIFSSQIDYNIGWLCAEIVSTIISLTILSSN